MGTDIKRPSPGSAEVWEFKAGKGSSQFRVFGRFAEVNVFVVLTGPSDRTKVNYSREMVRCQEIWRHLFGVQAPLYGRQEDDYIRPKAVAVRNS